MMREREEFSSLERTVLSQTEGGTASDLSTLAPALDESPPEPLIRIRPDESTVIPGLIDAWAHRELLYLFIWRDLKVRYRQTVLGIGWVVLQPLLMALVFAIFMGNLAHVPSQGVPYPLFAYAGLLPWTYFSNSVSTSGYSLIANSHLVTKVFFPRMLIPLAVVGVRLMDLLVAGIVLLILMFYFGIGISWSMLALPFLVTQATLLTVGFSIWSSALIAKYRDVGTLLPVLLQVWMFVSPVIYPGALVPTNWRWAYALNPMAGIIEGFRSALFGLPFDGASLLLSAIMTIALLCYFVWAFHRMETNVTDAI